MSHHLRVACRHAVYPVDHVASVTAIRVKLVIFATVSSCDAVEYLFTVAEPVKHLATLTEIRSLELGEHLYLHQRTAQTSPQDLLAVRWIAWLPVVIRHIALIPPLSARPMAWVVDQGDILVSIEHCLYASLRNNHVVVHHEQMCERYAAVQRLLYQVVPAIRNR